MRKNLRKICSILLAAGILLPAGAERAVQAAETASDVELKDGQRIASIRVLSIVGNELTYYEETTEQSSEKSTEEASEKPSEQQSEQPAEASTEQSSEQSSEQPPERPTEGMPEGSPPDNMGDFNPGKMQEEGTTTYLPVAVTVHTDTGEKMTFSILEEGDELEVLMEETESGEMILEIWMKSTEGDSDE